MPAMIQKIPDPEKASILKLITDARDDAVAPGATGVVQANHPVTTKAKHRMPTRIIAAPRIFIVSFSTMF